MLWHRCAIHLALCMRCTLHRQNKWCAEFQTMLHHNACVSHTHCHSHPCLCLQRMGLEHTIVHHIHAMWVSNGALQ